ncbi:hypothetical protein G7K_3126-t1 [Saitoella complicata NRRL Y-17804]|uniref:Uncharacterized protein n=1 Tax=Saitoella complicata (strain BCRC 22490 / CBS 7301 / JCM 7358 / NBRC 10748 / NRRL Y-17804) TaxID=698492 RepID=A0A0E9NHT3_SAICN|nr:hypothetical protein G7K_3126-t1 [Saitoella complicata NRRL Y-17804]
MRNVHRAWSPQMGKAAPRTCVGNCAIRPWTSGGPAVRVRTAEPKPRKGWKIRLFKLRPNVPLAHGSLKLQPEMLKPTSLCACGHCTFKSCVRDMGFENTGMRGLVLAYRWWSLKAGRSRGVILEADEGRPRTCHFNIHRTNDYPKGPPHPHRTRACTTRSLTPLVNSHRTIRIARTHIDLQTLSRKPPKTRHSHHTNPFLPRRRVADMRNVCTPFEQPFTTASNPPRAHTPSADPIHQ